MKKLLFLFTGLIVFAASGGGVYFALSMEGSTMLTIAGKESAWKKKKLPSMKHEDKSTASTLLRKGEGSWLVDLYNRPQQAGKKWTAHKVEVARVEVKNLVGMPLHTAIYNLEVETSGKSGVLSFALTRDPKSTTVKNYLVTWKSYLSVKAKRPSRANIKSGSKDYLVKVYAYRKGKAEGKYTEKVVRVSANGKVSIPE